MKQSKKVLSWLLILAMVLSMVPAMAFGATGTETWKAVDFESITSQDTIAITMSKDGATYVLPTVGEGGSKQPLAYTATAAGDSLTTPGGAEEFGWTVTATEGGYYITTGDKYLYVTANNNGVRVGATQSVWTLVDGYLSAQDSKPVARYLGVYEAEKSDWRCYTRTDTNIAGQTIGFWTLEGEAENTDPTETEPTKPTETEPPTETTKPTTGEVSGSKYVIAAKVGEVYYAMSNTFAKKTDAAEITVTDGKVSAEDVGAYVIELAEVDGGWTVKGSAGYLTYKSGTDLGTSADPYIWNISDGMNGSYRMTASTANTRGLLYRAGEVNKFGGYAVSNAKEGSTEYFDVELLPIDGEVILPPTETTQPTETTKPTETEPPVESTNPNEPAGTKYVIAAKVGEDYYAMSNTFAGKIPGTVIPVTDGKVSGDDAGAYAVILSQVSGGYTIYANGTYLTYKSNTNLGTSAEPYVWVLSAGVNGSSRLTSAAESKRGIVFRAGTYNQFAAYAVSNAEAGSTEYFDLELLPIEGEIVAPTVPPTPPAPTEPQCYKPKATPAAGYVEKGTQVSFSCSTKGSWVVYHTGDGNWTKFEDPITITEDITFTAKSQAEGYLDSAEVKFEYIAYTVGEQEAIQVTDLSELASGDKIIIVAKDYNFSLGTEQRNNNRGLGNVVKMNNICRYDDATQILTLEAGTTEDTFALYTGEGYLFAPVDSGNYLRTNDDKTDNGSFTITINEDGSASIVSIAAKDQTVLCYNTSKIFSLYAPAKVQKPVCIYKLSGQDRPALPENGDTVVLYNLAARGVLSAAQGAALKTVGATLTAEGADCTNGAFLFKVEKNGEAYRFYNESFGYLCAKGNTLSYSLVAENEANWTAEAYNGGYKLLSSEGKTLLGQTGSAKVGTQTGDRDTATFHFYPCSNTVLTDGVVNMPRIDFGNPSPANAGQDYLLHFTVDAVFGVKEVEATLAGTKLEINRSYGRYAISIPAAMIVGTALEITAKGEDNKGVAMSATILVGVKDEPMISDLKPVANSQTKENKKPEISAKLTNAGENPIVTMTVNGEAVAATYADGMVSYKPTSNLADGRTVVILTVTRQDGKTATKKWSFTVGEAKYTMLFGQLHAHTGEYSDGAGTLAGALDYIAGLPQDANVDFVAFTDHSNYFDTAAAPNPEDALYDLDLCTPDSAAKWTTYKDTLAQFNKDHAGELVLIPGFEMTWSGGPGHMNTFVTEGIVSRNNKTLNNKSADAGMRAYYELISREEGEEGITQLNHPGTTFGNFSDFAYWTPEADARTYLVEVGNGEGAIGSAGYFPSYEQYTMALDKGWHLAPTNNQDNHKGKWGNANEARDVILAEDFTEEAIYDAIRNYRVYATEDRNLEITYTVNELPMGTIIENVPETLNFSISIKDPDAADSISSIELIVNSGKVAYTWNMVEELASGVFTAELEPDYSYYYVRVIQADKDIAVTAPVWVGENLKLGIREATSDADIAVVGEELNIQTTFYNEEQADAIVKNIVYTVNGSQVLYVDEEVHLISAGSDMTVSLPYTPEEAKLLNIGITATLEYDGKEYVFTASVELDVTSADEVAYMGIDASHLNEYVSGKYAQMMGNFATLAKEANIRTKQLNSSADLIAACKDERMTVLVLNVPTRQLTQAKVYSAEELAALKAFNDRGGALILSGFADAKDGLDPHMAATQNALLEALGSALRLADDSAREGSYNGLYAYAFGEDEIAAGLEDSVYYYNGSTVYVVDAQGQPVDTLPDTVNGVLYGNYKTESRDEDKDGFGVSAVPKYNYNDPTYGAQPRYLLMAAERMEDKGMIFVSGVPFMNDYNIVFPAENGNNALAQNLLKAVNPVRLTDIAEVRKQTEVGYTFTIQGTVTSNASGYDKDTAFFDCIYVQDETAGINCFPVAGEFKIGDVVQIKGQTEFYVGEPELQVQTIEKLGETTPVEPVEITAAQLNDRSVEGSLITLKGFVTKITMANGLVESIYVIDAEGTVGRAFIDGYITANNEVKDLAVGRAISVTGVASYDNTYAIEHDSYARIRVRDRADIVTSDHEHTVATLEAVAPTCTETGLTEGQYCSVCAMVLKAQEEIPATGHTMADGTCTVCGYEEPKEEPFPFTDVPETEWYREAVEYVFENKLMNGMNATTYAPQKTLTRAMLVTILYRMAGSPEVEIDNVFTDVAEGQWYTEAILWGYDNGIVMGMGKGLFAPNNAVTREQMVTFLYRYAKYAGYDLSKAETTDLSDYVDADTVSDYAVDAFAWAVGEGIVNGLGKNNLGPKGTATRAQVAQVIMKFHRMAK